MPNNDLFSCEIHIGTARNCGSHAKSVIKSGRRQPLFLSLHESECFFYVFFSVFTAKFAEEILKVGNAERCAEPVEVSQCGKYTLFIFSFLKIYGDWTSIVWVNLLVWLNSVAVGLYFESLRKYRLFFTQKSTNLSWTNPMVLQEIVCVTLLAKSVIKSDQRLTLFLSHYESECFFYAQKWKVLPPKLKIVSCVFFIDPSQSSLRWLNESKRSPHLLLVVLRSVTPLHCYSVTTLFSCKKLWKSRQKRDKIRSAPDFILAFTKMRLFLCPKMKNLTAKDAEIKSKGENAEAHSESNSYVKTRMLLQEIVKVTPGAW